jgi:hypothetical protein
MSADSQSTIRDFLNRYRAARVKQAALEAQGLADQLGGIRSSLEAAKQRRAELAHLFAPDFNIFNILDVTEKEFVHSNLLGELLDPSGTHGCGTLFLSSFLDLCEPARNGMPPLSAEIDTWASDILVRREAAIFRGRFDLLIHAPGHLCLIIENKINAAAGDSQLSRYRDWLKKRPEPTQSKLLIFLTPRMKGRSAGDIRDGEYIWLSYVTHIWNWLEECRERIKAPSVRSLIDQYLGTIAEWRNTEDARAEP